MRATEAQKSGVLKWIEKWRPRLLLQNWRIECIWRGKPCKDDTPEQTTEAECVTPDAGLHAQVNVYPGFWTNRADVQERLTLHELLHIVAPGASEPEINLLTEILWIAYEGNGGVIQSWPIQKTTSAV